MWVHSRKPEKSEVIIFLNLLYIETALLSLHLYAEENQLGISKHDSNILQTQLFLFPVW